MKKIFIILMLIVFISLTGCKKTTTTKNDNQGGDNTTSEIHKLGEGYDKNTTLGNVSEYSIVLSPNATEAEKYAASIIQSYIKEITGLKLDSLTDETDLSTIKAFVIGRNKKFDNLGITLDFEEYNESGFLIKTIDDDIFLCGAIDRGTIYAALDIVEYMFGVKFITSDFTYIPKVSELKVCKTDLKSIPAFRYRIFLGPDEYDNSNKTYLVNRRYLSDYISLSEGLGGNIKMYREFKGNNTHNDFEYVDLESLIENEHIKEEYIHAFSNDGDGRGTNGAGGYANVIKEERYESTGKYASDFCFTDGIYDNGEAYTEITVNGTTTKTAYGLILEGLKNVILNDEAESNYYLIGQRDFSSRPCLCARCMEASEKYTNAGIMIRFFNKLLDDIEGFKESEGIDREINIVMFAYQYTTSSPVVQDENGNFKPIDETCIARDNLVIRLAPITCDFSLELDDEFQSTNSTGSDFIDKWKVVASKFMIWSYHACYAYYYMPLPTIQTFTHNFDLLKDIGLVYMLMQSNYEEKTIYQTKLDNYVSAKMMWDNHLDPNELIEEFNYYYFGEAASKYVNDYYFLTLSQFMTNKDSNPNYSTRGSGYCTNNTIFTKGYLLKALSIFEEAISAVGNDDSLTETEKNTYLRRLKEAQLSPRYACLINGALLGYSETELYEEAYKFIEDALSLGGKQYGESMQRRFDLENLIFK